jgi:hypothetical protein
VGFDPLPDARGSHARAPRRGGRARGRSRAHVDVASFRRVTSRRSASARSASKRLAGASTSQVEDAAAEMEDGSDRCRPRGARRPCAQGRVRACALGCEATDERPCTCARTRRSIPKGSDVSRG